MLAKKVSRVKVNDLGSLPEAQSAGGPGLGPLCAPSHPRSVKLLRSKKEIAPSVPGRYVYQLPLLNRAFTQFYKHGFHETCHFVTSYFMKKKTPNDAVTPQCLSQFTPKMKANAVLRLLSSLV